MKFAMPGAEVYCWDGCDPAEAFSRTTHLGIGAHQDDLEIAAIAGILECFHVPGRAFSGVVVTDGAGSARDAEYAKLTDEEMRAVRRREQKKAAHIGEYAALALLDHPSRAVKDPKEANVIQDLTRILELARPQVVYTHNLCDKHDTHVAVVLRAISAIRTLPSDARPEKVIGCEVWRDLDWLPDDLKVEMNVTRRDNLSSALLGVFDSQISGGKRYDLASLGRRRAHATFSESHAVDQAEGVVLGMDLTSLVSGPEVDPIEFVEGLISAFSADVRGRIREFAAG